MAQHFQALLGKDEDVDATRVAISFDVPAAFGSKARVPVRGTINGVAFRSSIFPYGGVHYLIVNKTLRAEAKMKAGEVVDIVMERDDEPRTVTLPADLEQALQASGAAIAGWERASYSRRRELAGSIEEAKQPETRARRVEKAIAELVGAGLASTTRNGQ